jgi:hypothetical protein
VSFADSLDCVGVIGKDVTFTSKIFGSVHFLHFSQTLVIYIGGLRGSLCV